MGKIKEIKYLSTLFSRRSILVITFKTHQDLTDAMNDILTRRLSDMVDIGHAAIVLRSQEGYPLILNNNVTLREGPISGFMIGVSILPLGLIQAGALELPGAWAVMVMLVGILFGGVIGALVGYGIATRINFGFRAQLLNDLGAQLHIGEASLVLQARPAQVAAIREVFKELNACVEDRKPHSAGHTE